MAVDAHTSWPYIDFVAVQTSASPISCRHGVSPSQWQLHFVVVRGHLPNELVGKQVNPSSCWHGVAPPQEHSLTVSASITGGVNTVGAAVGAALGAAAGATVGSPVGSAVGSPVGCTVGAAVAGSSPNEKSSTLVAVVALGVGAAAFFATRPPALFALIPSVVSPEPAGGGAPLLSAGGGAPLSSAGGGAPKASSSA
jgi:hypothetical protein